MATVEQGSAGDGLAPLVSEAGDKQGDQARSSEVVEQAKVELSVRYGFRPEEAFAVLSALARSQRCTVEEFADSVVTSGGRLDGDVRGDPDTALTGIRDGSVPLSVSAELVIEAHSAASAFVLAGSLAEYGARAIVEGQAWWVVVDRCSSFSEGISGALSRTRSWLSECGLATTSVTHNGETYLLDGSLDAVGS
jgi:hypothetical protein